MLFSEIYIADNMTDYNYKQPVIKFPLLRIPNGDNSKVKYISPCTGNYHMPFQGPSFHMLVCRFLTTLDYPESSFGTYAEYAASTELSHCLKVPRYQAFQFNIKYIKWV